MRPVDRGSVPTDDKGIPITFRQYDTAKYYLRNRLGPFCSYCERRVTTHLNVEHLEARATGGAVVDWDNFLLSCGNCNPTKGTQPIAGLYFPHEMNTAFAFEYRDGAIIIANPALPSQTEKDAAMATLALFGLDNLTPSKPGDNDTRWDDYRERWGQATRSLERWRSRPTNELKAQIAETVRDNGAFSIYMAVFQNEHEVREEILSRFDECHTRRGCFDAGTTAVISRLDI